MELFILCCTNHGDLIMGTVRRYEIEEESNPKRYLFETLLLHPRSPKRPSTTVLHATSSSFHSLVSSPTQSFPTYLLVQQRHPLTHSYDDCWETLRNTLCGTLRVGSDRLVVRSPLIEMSWRCTRNRRYENVDLLW